MRKWLIAVTIAVLVVAFGTLAVQAAPAGSNGSVGLRSRAEHEHRNFRLSISFGADPRIDIHPAGPSLGDVHVLDDVLLRDGKPIGHTGGSCTLTDLQRPEEACTMTFSLPGGIITGQWLNTPPVHKVVAVTGGTGIYRKVRGEARVVEFSTTKGAVTFDLIGVDRGRD